MLHTAKKKKEKKREVPADIRKKVKKRHPDAGVKEMRQFMAVFDGAKDNGESDSRAYAKAWGVLNQNKNLGDSHRETDKDETKKKVKKWEKKTEWKDKKKKSSVSYELRKLAGVLELLGESDKSDEVHDMAKQMKEVFHTSNDPETEPCKTPGSVFHIFVEDNEVGARVNLPFDLELEEEEYQELEDDIHDALEEILSKYFEEDKDEEG
jgi:hypothetical protein